MTSLLDHPPRNVMDVLRGERGERPLVNTDTVARVRAILEDELATMLVTHPSGPPLVINAAALSDVPHRDAGPSLAQVRGSLVNLALQLCSVRAGWASGVDEALATWRDVSAPGAMNQFIDHLSADERARLSTDVDAHVVTLTRSLGEISPRWRPRTALRASQRLANGRVVLRDVVDLMVGTIAGDVASVALLDVTTAALGEGAERVLRYHALVQTLRTGVVPLRSSIFSSATGELWCHDVDDELLDRSIADVLTVARRQVVS